MSKFTEDNLSAAKFVLEMCVKNYCGLKLSEDKNVIQEASFCEGALMGFVTSMVGEGYEFNDSLKLLKEASKNVKDADGSNRIDAREIVPKYLPKVWAFAWERMLK